MLLRATIALSLCTVVYAGANLWLQDEPRQSASRPSRLRIGILPDQSPERLHDRYRDLLAHLSQSVGLPCELVMPEDYGQLAQMFEQGQLEAAYFGGYTFLMVHQNVAAQPLVMRDVDLRFWSVFVARRQEGAKKLTDFRGRSFAFGSSHVRRKTELTG